MRTKTVGIDLSADPTKTAVCVIEWRKGGKGKISHLRKGTKQEPWDDEDLLELINDADKTGIDAPFGWPLPFIEEVKKWMGKANPKKPFVGDTFEPYRLRQTDLQIKKPRRPLSVSSDRIAVTAMRCARLIAATGDEDRTGVEGKLMEVYPASALSHWKLMAEGYKDGKRQQRETLVADLGKRLKKVCPMDPKAVEECQKHHDCLDALVAALVVRAFQLDQTSRPDPDQELAASKEGWLHVPTCQLSEF